ncbi:MFS transporter [Polymorphospora rubra]|uniref:MFS transporter n=1 Tax=Polymorphospora rubra TaxID=338584 RepID=UPI003407CFC0
MIRGPAMLGVLRIRDFRNYYIGYTTSAFGDVLTPFALAFAVLHLTGSPTALGIVVLSTRLPIIVFALVGGAVGDRFSRRTIMLTTDGVRFVAQAATAAILLTGVAQVWMLVVLQLTASAGAAFFNPAAQGLITSVVDKPHLRQANSLLAVSRSATSIIAVGSAGALVALTDPGWAIGVDALTYLVSATALSRLPRAHTAGHPGHKDGLLTSIRTGLSEVRSRTWLWVWTAHVGLINLLVISPIFVLGPYVADTYLGGAPAWAAVGISYAVGGLIGGIVSSRWKAARPMAAALACSMMVVPLAVTLAVPASLWLIVAASLFGGVQVSIYNVFQMTTVQNELPDDLIARATSVLMLGGHLAVPIGTGLAGPIAAALGTRTVLGAIAVAAVLVTVGTLAVPATWRIRTASTPEPSPVTPAPTPASPQEIPAPEAGKQIMTAADPVAARPR